jgi:nucleoside-diphosphate-sugar epimerase
MYLVSGTKSGLGKYLQENLIDAVAYSRESGLGQANSVQSFEAIIHCAVNASRQVTYTDLNQYIESNLLLTQKLLNIPHKKFIFISSSDVYPRADHAWHEDDNFQVDKADGIYALSKLFSEAMVKNQTSNYLILRPTAMLGAHARMNSLMKILANSNESLTLSDQSTFNYILHADVMAFINKAMKDDISGIYNLAANENIRLGDVAKLFNCDVNFGSYTYTVADLANDKAKNVCSEFTNSSLENIKKFKSSLGVPYAEKCN